MNKYKETAALQAFAQQLQEYQATRDLGKLEDLEVYIHTIRERFIQQQDFPVNFAEGYELLRQESESFQKRSNKYSRDKYLEE